MTMPNYINDPALLAQLNAKADPFDSALKAEGLTGPAAEIARSIYQQESSSGKNTKTSNAGAVGGMQIIPGTFKSVADKDWNINDPEQNARAGIRYVKQLYEQAGGDPALTAAGYYGGPGGLEKARRGVAVSDPRNPGAPNTLQYGAQVAARVPKEKGLLQRGVEAVIPSAEAGPAYGNRPDGTPKGRGFLGELKRPDGDVSTEISVGVNIGGKEMDIPTLVPTLTKAEIDQLLSTKGSDQIPEAIIQKAVDYAKTRIAAGKPVFAGPGELLSPAAKQTTRKYIDDPALLEQLNSTEGIPRVEVRGTSADEPPGLLKTADEAIKAGAAGARNIGFGAVRGAGSIGATLLAPYDMAKDAMEGKGLSLESNRQRRADMDAGLASLGADTDSIAFQGGKLAGEIAGTAGVGSAMGAGAKLLGAAPKVVSALQTGGMSLGGAPAATIGQGAANLATRVGAGALTGGVSAGMVDPQQAGTGALIGGSLPVASKVAQKAGNAAGTLVGKAFGGGKMDSEVRALAERAKQLGIDIPADRLVDSKPLNAVAASLEYVPFSGRAGTMRKMESQLNRAVSRTFGQDSDNVASALRKAGDDLGTKFGETLSKNTVKIDRQFMDDLGEVSARATRELPPDLAGIINKQIDDIVGKGGTGEIDGQAAYNIKKTLDAIGRRNSSEAFYAKDLQKTLMEALNRSLGPSEAAAFKTVRQQYGNMLSMEKLVQNGADSGISIAKLANMKNINNAELQELADISAQFLKGRESNHGAMQRVGAGLGATMLGTSTGTLPAMAGGVVAGRTANSLLNSGMMRNSLMGYAPGSRQLLGQEGNQLLYRIAPVAGSQ